MAWYPQAIVRRYPADGGSMVGGPSRLTLHYTQTTGVPGYGGFVASNSAPHFTVDRAGNVYQHHPTERASRALRNVEGGVQTNRQGTFNVQIELVGYSERPHDMPEVQRVASRELIRWILQVHGIPQTWRNISRGSHCYGSSSSCRMSFVGWVGFSGICAHNEVPENSHWDTGALDFAWLLAGTEEDEEDMWAKSLTEAQWRQLWRAGIAVADTEAALIDYWVTKAALRPDSEWADAGRSMIRDAILKIAMQAGSTRGVEPQFAIAWAWAVQQGLVATQSDPDDLVVKEELMVFLHRYLKDGITSAGTTELAQLFSTHVAKPDAHGHKHSEGVTGGPVAL